MDGDSLSIIDTPGELYIEACPPCYALIGNYQIESLLAAITEIVRNEIAASRARGGVW